MRSIKRIRDPSPKCWKYHNTTLISPRRLGKTELIYRFFEYLAEKNDFETVYVDHEFITVEGGKHGGFEKEKNSEINMALIVFLKKTGVIE